jgi:hypothetical protein
VSWCRCKIFRMWVIIYIYLTSVATEMIGCQHFIFFQNLELLLTEQARWMHELGLYVLYLARKRLIRTTRDHIQWGKVHLWHRTKQLSRIWTQVHRLEAKTIQRQSMSYFPFDNIVHSNITISYVNLYRSGDLTKAILLLFPYDWHLNY